MCVCVCLFVEDSCRRRRCAHEDVQPEPLPAPGTPSKTTRLGQRKREKDMKARRERACVSRHMARARRQMFLAWRGEVSAHSRPVAAAAAVAPRDEQTDVWRGCAGILGLSELIQPHL